LAGGAKLGNRTNLAEAREKAVAAIETNADRFAANVLPIIREVQRAGAKMLRDIADALIASRCRHAQRRSLVCDVGEERVGSGIKKNS
jgi:hypothetical protein